MTEPPKPSKKPDPKSPEDQSQDATRVAREKDHPAWETRQPAQVTKADVEQARKNPDVVSPPGEMGESQGAAS